MSDRTTIVAADILAMRDRLATLPRVTVALWPLAPYELTGKIRLGKLAEAPAEHVDDLSLWPAGLPATVQLSGVWEPPAPEAIVMTGRPRRYTAQRGHRGAGFRGRTTDRRELTLILYPRRSKGWRRHVRRTKSAAGKLERSPTA